MPTRERMITIMEEKIEELKASIEEAKSEREVLQIYITLTNRQIRSLKCLTGKVNKILGNTIVEESEPLEREEQEEQEYLKYTQADKEFDDNIRAKIAHDENGKGNKNE